MKQTIFRRIEACENIIFRNEKAVDINKTMIMIADLIRKRDMFEDGDPEFPEEKELYELINKIN